MKLKYCIPYIGVHLAFMDNELDIFPFAMLAFFNFNLSTIALLISIGLLW